MTVTVKALGATHASATVQHPVQHIHPDVRSSLEQLIGQLDQLQVSPPQPTIPVGLLKRVVQFGNAVAPRDAWQQFTHEQAHEQQAEHRQHMRTQQAEAEMSRALDVSTTMNTHEDHLAMSHAEEASAGGHLWKGNSVEGSGSGEAAQHIAHTASTLRSSLQSGFDHRSKSLAQKHPDRSKTRFHPYGGDPTVPDEKGMLGDMNTSASGALGDAPL